MTKTIKACKDENYLGKARIFNEILLIQTSLDEIFGVPPQMKLNPPLLNHA